MKMGEKIRFGHWPRVSNIPLINNPKREQGKQRVND